MCWSSISISSGAVSYMCFSNGFVVDKPGFYQSPVNILEKHIYLSARRAISCKLNPQEAGEE